MGKSGWGYHYTPCNGGGGWWAAAAIGAGLLIGAAGKAVARAAGTVLHAAMVAAEVAAVVVVSAVALAAVYGVVRVVLWAHRRTGQRPVVAPVPVVTVTAEAIAAPRAAIEGKPVLTGTVLAREREAVR